MSRRVPDSGNHRPVRYRPHVADEPPA